MRNLIEMKWFKPALVVVMVGLVYFVSFVVLGKPDYERIEDRLVEQYDLSSIRWETNGMRQRDTLVLDGQDVSDTCLVTGYDGSLDALRIECDEPVGMPAVDEDQ